MKVSRASHAEVFMRFSFRMGEPVFLGMLDDMAGQVRLGATKFLDLLQQFDDLEARGSKLKRQEEVCDSLVAEILTSVNRAFITPLDREDVHALATRLDDVMDMMEETAHRFVAFRIDCPTAQAIALARIVSDCCAHLEPAVRLCREQRSAGNVQDHLREIGRLENEADRIYRDADAELYANDPADILGLIKWRELYARLEDTVDACKEVAHVVSEIVIKGR
jgi:uncharacterized protein Yka (UPF0111/DUF47 family)